MKNNIGYILIVLGASLLAFSLQQLDKQITSCQQTLQKYQQQEQSKSTVYSPEYHNKFFRRVI